MRWLDHVALDVRHAMRSIARMPVLATVVIVSLGFGIGINAVVFSWIQARLLRPLPGVPHGASFHLVEPRNEGGAYPGMSWVEYRDVADRVRAFQALIAFRMAPFYVGDSGQIERMYGQLVSANYFHALGIEPALGRFLRPDEVSRPGGELVAVIAHGLWQRRLAASRDVLGETLRVNGRELTIVGVAPEAFQGTVPGLDFQMWVPATLAPILVNSARELDDRGIRGYSVMGRLRPSTTRAQAQAELDAVMRQLAHTYPDTNGTIVADVLPPSQSPRGPNRMLNGALLILQALMLLLLLAVCGNTANLVLARASTRQREVGVRLALGAPRWRIVTTLLTECVVLSVAGAIVGVAIAVWGTQALLVLPLTGLPLKLQTHVDGVTFAFSLALGVLCGVTFGAAPALQLARVDPQLAFRAGQTSAGRSGLRNALMGVQVALAIFVLMVAGMFLRSFLETRGMDTGFKRAGILLAGYDLRGRNTDETQTRVFTDRLVERMRAIPGVQAAAVATAVPLDIHGLPTRTFTVEGRPRSDGTLNRASSNVVSPGYFATMGIPFRAGTDFVSLDDSTTAPQIVVNEAFVKRYLAGEEPIGRRVELRSNTYTIAGVVRDSLSNAFGEPPTPVIYVSYRDNPSPQGEIHLRTRPGAETALTSQMRQAAHALDPELPVFNVRTLDDHVETNLVLRRIPARMFAILAPVLLTLASIGIYAVVAYAVSLRTTEIGVRLALGAPARRVVALFVAQSLAVITIGALVGWLIALIVALDVRRDAIDVPVFLGVPMLLMAVATFACWLPARRAARLDPVVALRQEA